MLRLRLNVETDVSAPFINAILELHNGFVSLILLSVIARGPYSMFVHSASAATLKLPRQYPVYLRGTRCTIVRAKSSMAQRRVAVLYQSLEPPVINGVQKPKKPGGM